MQVDRGQGTERDIDFYESLDKFILIKILGDNVPDLVTKAGITDAEIVPV